MEKNPPNRNHDPHRARLGPAVDHTDRAKMVGNRFGTLGCRWVTPMIDIAAIVLCLWAAYRMLVFGHHVTVTSTQLVFATALESARAQSGEYPPTAEEAASSMAVMLQGKRGMSVSYEPDTDRIRFTVSGETVSVRYDLPKGSDEPQVEFRPIRSLPGKVRHYLESSPTLLLLLAALPVVYLIWGRRRLFRRDQQQA